MVNNTHTDLSRMFNGCTNLISVNTEGWDTSNVTTLYQMFRNCKSLTSLDISSFNTRNVTDMSYIFNNCSLLEIVNMSNWDMTKVTDESNRINMFSGCSSLHTLRLDNCSNDTINKIITSPNFPTNAISGVIRTIYCKEENATGLTAPINWVFNHNIEEMPEIPEARPLYTSGEFAGKTNITTANVIVNSSHTELNNMFNGCTNLTSVNTEGWDTSNVNNMMNIFNSCKSLVELDLSSFNTSNVANMNWMFYYCESLETLDIRNFDTSKATINMRDMFYNCTALTTLRLDNCSKATISSIITQSSFPANNRGTIYCRRANAEGLAAPGNWIFSYIDID